MKSKLLLILALVPFALFSCLENKPMQHTPELRISIPVRYHSVGDSLCYDTLHVWGSENGMNLDTIAVGDTVRYDVMAYTYMNNMVSLTFSWDTAALAMQLMPGNTGDSIRKALDAGSDVEKGKLLFVSNYNGVRFPVQYITRRVGTSEISIRVVSDGDFPERQLKFKQTVQ